MKVYIAILFAVLGVGIFAQSIGNIPRLDAAKMNAVNVGLIGRWNITATNPTDLVATYNLTTTGSGLVAGDVTNGHASGQGGVTLNNNDCIDVANLDGRRIPGDFTNTGLALDSDGTFWIGNFGTGDIVHATNSATATELTILSTISVCGANQLQGVTIDTWDDTIWYTEHSNKLVGHTYKDGTDIPNGWNTGFTNNGISYEAGRSSLWVVELIAAGSPQKLHRFDTNGIEQEVVTLSTLATNVQVDGIVYSAHNDTLWVSADFTSSTTASIIYNINKTTGATNYHFSALPYPESLAITPSGTNMYYNVDALFHNAQYTGNRVYNTSTNGIILNRIITNQFSLTAWVKPSTASPANAGIVTKEYASISLGEFAMLSISGSLFTRFGTTAGVIQQNSGGTNLLSDTNKWYFVAGTYDGSKMLNYVNGVPDRTNAATTGNVMATDGPIKIGRRNAGNTFPGIVSDVRIYNRALSSNEVKYLSTR